MTQPEATSKAEAQPVATAGGKILVIGGNGYLATRVLEKAMQKGYRVTALSRHPPKEFLRDNPKLQGVRWIQGDALDPEPWKHELQDATAVVVATADYRWRDLFGNQRYLQQVCGETGVSVSKAACGFANIQKFAFVSAHHYPPFVKLLPGYFKGKDDAEYQINHDFGSRAILLRPGFLYGKRTTTFFGKRVVLPLDWFARPFEYLAVGSLSRMVASMFGRNYLFHPPLNVEDVARVVIAGITGDIDKLIPKTEESRALVLESMDMYGIADKLRHEVVIR